MLKLLISLLASLALLKCNAHDFTNCGTVDHLRVSKLELSEEQIVPGTTLDVSIHGNPDIEISTNAQALVEIRVMGIKLYSETMDLCSEFEVECPLKPGENFVAKMSYEVPLETPRVTIDMSVKITDFTSVKITEETPGDISCFDTKFKVGTNYRFLFNKFVKEHSLEVDNFEKRLKIFTEHVLSITEHNLKRDKTYTKEMNKFGLMTEDEFRNILGYSRERRVVIQNEFESRSRLLKEYNNLPASVDWVEKGAVTPVKNQGKCGSCWSFSTTGAIEGAYFLKTGKLKSFSEQQLVDCDKGSMGCKGGLMDQAFKWIGENRGLCLESDYPYTSSKGSEGACTKCKIVKGSEVKKFVDVQVNSEDELMKAVSQQPVSVAIEADQTSFQFYKTGVLTGRCGHRLDHGVLVVGYGTSDDGVDFWKVKNSWGSSWGEKGYIRIQRGKVKMFDKSGECGILASASYPVLV